MSHPKTITCKNCGAELKRPPALEPNMRLQCGACGRQMLVKTPKAVKTAKVVAAEPVAQSSSLGTTTLVVAALLLLMAGGLFGYAITVLNSRDDVDVEVADAADAADAAEEKANAETKSTPVDSPAPATNAATAAEKPATKADAVDRLAKVSTDDVASAQSASTHRFLSSTGRVLATGIVLSFDGQTVVVQAPDGEKTSIEIDKLRQEDQKFVLDQPRANRNDFPGSPAPPGTITPGTATPTQAVAGVDSTPASPGEMPAPPEEPPAVPVNAPPGFPEVRDWMGPNDEPLIRGEIGGVKPGNRVVIGLIARDWNVVKPVDGRQLAPFRGKFWVFYEEASAGPQQPGDVMVRVGEASIPGHDLSWIDIPRSAFCEEDQLYLDAIESMRGYAQVSNNRLLYFQVPLNQLSQFDQDYVLSVMNEDSPGPRGEGPPPQSAPPGQPGPPSNGSPPNGPPSTGPPPAAGPPQQGPPPQGPPSSDGPPPTNVPQ